MSVNNYPLMPGQERVERIETTHGSKIRYSYCSERGNFFSCVAADLQDAQDRCEQHLLSQERY